MIYFVLTFFRLLLNKRIKAQTIKINAINCNPNAKLSNRFSINLDSTSIPTPNKSSSKGEVVLKKDKNLFMKS